MPGVLFVKAAYRYVLRREADEVGLQHYVQLLSRGCGKKAVLIDLMNSREGRRISRLDEQNTASASLLRELEQLHGSHGRNFFTRWLRDSRRKRELNALQFNLEIVLASTIDSLRDRITQELQQRAATHAGAPSAIASHSRVVDALQVQRRAVSRPASQRDAHRN